MEDIKQASNFELNVIKIGIKRFQLVAGDEFKEIRGNFGYYPSSRENIMKLPIIGDTWHRRKAESLSCKKYKKDILRADNIEQIEEGVWKVKYAHIIEEEKIELLVLMKIGKTNIEFESVELEVERETEKTFFLRKDHPITYSRPLPKSDIGKVFGKYEDKYVVCRINQYDEMYSKLLDEYKASLLSSISNLKYKQELLQKKLELFERKY